MRWIDLRSDTVTKPTPAMLGAMQKAPLGDDVYGEDPTVNELESYASSLFGKEAALYCPSGTMTNQIAIKVHTQPGDELICDEHAHIFNFESGGIAFNSGVQARLVKGEEGRLTPKLIEPVINGNYDWLAPTTLVCIENTVNRAGGSYYNLEQMKDISEFCRRKGLKVHLDGARIFNAITETGDDTRAIGREFDSVSICLSKGLGAPVGSLLLGDKMFIAKARRFRKIMGGGMRQAGVLAAAGFYALQHNIERLSDDHRRAKALGVLLGKCSFVENVLPVYSNIVIFKLDHTKLSGEDFEKKLAACNIKVAPFGKQTVRMVTHLDFDEQMLAQVQQSLEKISAEVLV